MENDPERITLGKLIRQYRLALGWSQDTLAMKSNLCRAQIGRIERNVCIPTVDTINSIADALHVQRSLLLDASLNSQTNTSAVQEINDALHDFQKEAISHMTDTQLLHISEAVNTITDFIKR